MQINSKPFNSHNISYYPSGQGCIFSLAFFLPLKVVNRQMKKGEGIVCIFFPTCELTAMFQAMGMQHFGLHEQMAAHHNLDAKAHFDRYSLHQWQQTGELHLPPDQAAALPPPHPLLHSPHLWGRELILAPSSGMQRRQWLTSSSFIHKFTIMLSKGPSTHSAPLNSCFSNSSVSTIYCKLNCTKIRFNSIVDQGPWLGCQYWSALCLIGHPTNIGRVQSE